LKFGSKQEDLLFDFEHGHLEAAGGPVREAAIDPASITDLSKLTRTDRVVSKWAGWGFRDSDAPRKLFRQNKDGTFSVVVMDFITEHRKGANSVAASILEDARANKRKIRECEVLRVLRMWRFAKNDSRQNVMPEGQDFVFSDTLGLIRARDGRYMEKEATKEFPDVTRLLCQWFKDNKPAEMQDDFPFTSINVNFKYAARRHRDGNNCGPSMIKALGNFTGGELGYWPGDDQKTDLDALPASDRESLNLKSGFALFNGNCAHEVDTFEGERFSLVFFAIGKSWKTPKEVKDFLTGCGINFPTDEVMERTKAMLQTPRGYTDGVANPPVDTSTPSKALRIGHWHTDPAELAEADAEPEETAAPAAAPAAVPAAAPAAAAAAVAEAPAPRAGGAGKASASGKRGRATGAAASEKAETTPAKKSRVASAALGVTPSTAEVTPAKAGRQDVAKRGSVVAEQKADSLLDASTVEQATKLGLVKALQNLAGRAELAGKGLAGPILLEALQKSGGLVNPAKRLLLEGSS